MSQIFPNPRMTKKNTSKTIKMYFDEYQEDLKIARESGFCEGYKRGKAHALKSLIGGEREDENYGWISAKDSQPIEDIIVVVLSQFVDLHKEGCEYSPDLGVYYDDEKDKDGGYWIQYPGFEDIIVSKWKYLYNLDGTLPRMKALTGEEKMNELRQHIKRQTLEQHRNSTKYDGQNYRLLILGGGTCLVKDLRRWSLVKSQYRFGEGYFPKPWTTFRMAINHHANILFPLYAVVEDMPIINLMKDTSDTIVMGRYQEADIDISEAPNWNNGGMNAVWIAEYLGFKEIILCGFDCFKEAQRYYWHDPIFALSQFDHDIHDEVMDVWREVKENLRFPERVKSISGPLTEVFGEWSLNKQR